MKKILIIILMSLSFDSLAQEMTPKPDPMQKIISGKGKISKQEYDEFWQYMEANNEKEKRDIINSMRKNYLPMQKYQKESWACVKKAWDGRKKVPCPQADAVAAAYKKANGVNFPATIINMTDAMIEGAAARKPVSLIKDVAPLPLTAKSITESENFFQNSIERLDQVLRVSY